MMFKHKPKMPLAGKYVIFKIICTKCGWEKDSQMESIDGFINHATIRLKKEKMRLRYRKCPQCGGDVEIKENVVIS